MLGVEMSDGQPMKVRPLVFDSDLFDAEDSDSGMEYTARSPTPPLEDNPPIFSDVPPSSPSQERNSQCQQDEEETANHPGETLDDEGDRDDTERPESPSSKKKAAKSSIAQSRTRRVQKTDIKKIHSESQRIIRESDVSLPYHKPKPLSLNDFFSKKPSKANILSVKSLKGLSKSQQIARLTQQQAQPTSEKVNEKEQAALTQTSPSSKFTGRLEGHSLLSSSSASAPLSSNEQLLNGSEEDAVPLKIDQEQLESDCLSEAPSKHWLVLEDSEDDSDIQDRGDAPPVTNLREKVGGQTQTDVEGEADGAVEGEADGAVEGEADGAETSTNEKTLSKTVASPEEASPLRDGMDKDGDENKEANLSLSDRETEDGLEKDSSILATSAKAESGDTDGHPPAPSQAPVPSQGPSGRSHRQMLLEASLAQVKTLTPRLSGAGDLLIDLDGGDEDPCSQFAMPSNPGLNRLMERFAKHTSRSIPRPRKEVKLSVVSKEMGVDGKEDLKLETLAVTIEGEETEDPSLKVPGAKLLKLKESLQAKMRARREVERQRRQEAYRLDNEDYMEEDEGELTDKSDTDGEQEDRLGDEGKEKKIKTSCFINHEAAVDEDDDDDYDPEEDSEDDGNEDETDGEDQQDDGDGQEDLDEDSTEAKVYSTDEDDDEEEVAIKRFTTASAKKKKKKLVLEDEDEEDEDEAKAGEESTLELHLDADDESDEAGDKTKTRDDSSAGIPYDDRMPSFGGKAPRSDRPDPHASRPMGRLVLDSVSSLDGTTDSSDVDKLGESLHRGVASPRRGLLTTEDKTRDLFESASNTDGGTTGSSEADRVSVSLAGRVGFSWSAIKKNQGSVMEDSGRELPKHLDNSSNSLDTSFEMMDSMIPAHQPGGGVRRQRRQASVEGATDNAFMPFSKHQALLHSIPKTSSKLSELTLPVEDSQDLFRVDTPSLTIAMETQQGTDTQSFRFSYEDEETQSQFLDENGFLMLRSATKPKLTTKKLFTEETTSQDQLDELLGLCSGKFTSGTDSNSNSKIRKGLFSQLTAQRVEGTQGNMDELLGLCSGTFTLQKEEPLTKSTLPIPNDDIDGRSESSFHILSDDEGHHSDQDGIRLSDGDDNDHTQRKKKRKRIRMMEDGDSDDEVTKDTASDDAEEDEDEEEVFDSEDELSLLIQQEDQQEKQRLPGKQEKAKIPKLSRGFFEQEAELSGSEYGSDEDYDAEDVPDELEQEEADLENVGTEDQLREQVNKVHMKTMDDDDARRLRLYKEMYLPDGDLHSDGKGRTRQFRWRHLDNDSQMHLFPVNSDGEDEEEQDEDTQWRMERFKREQWLNEQKDKQTVKGATNNEDVEEENSQFDLLMKTAVNRKRKELTPANVNEVEPVPKKDNEKRISSPKLVKFRHGSFLKRSKCDLAKIASMMKPLTGNTNVKRTSRNVLYQSISSQADEEEQKPQLKRSVSESPASQTPQPKRPRLDRTLSLAKPSSIFSLGDF